MVVSLEKMNQIIDMDCENGVVVVEPGCIVHDIQVEVESNGLFYPLDPASLSYCTIGGNIAENAGGPRAIKWNNT